jgi:RimJ/RimL family protein N-acetyltransferase
MKIILKTKRLYLREFIPSDGYHFYHLNNNEKVLKYTGDIPFKTEEEAYIFIENYAEYKNYNYGRWAVCLRKTDEFIGWCGLKNSNNEVDLGFRFYQKYWNNGYATEAAIACLNYGFTSLKMVNIIARAYKENIASIKVLQKCAMTFQKHIIYDGVPAVLYSKTNHS